MKNRVVNMRHELARNVLKLVSVKLKTTIRKQAAARE